MSDKDKAAPVGERDHYTKGSRKALGAMNAKLKAKVGRLERELAAHQRQQAREVVMPEIPYQWSKSLTHCWPDDKDDRDGDWCVGCIDEEGFFYEVVKVEASQYDAGGESQKIAEAIVALWEFARLNKGAGSHE